MFMFHHQIKKNLNDLNQSFQLLKLKNTIKLSLSRLHQAHQFHNNWLKHNSLNNNPKKKLWYVNAVQITQNIERIIFR